VTYKPVEATKENFFDTQKGVSHFHPKGDQTALYGLIIYPGPVRKNNEGGENDTYSK